MEQYKKHPYLTADYLLQFYFKKFNKLSIVPNNNDAIAKEVYFLIEVCKFLKPYGVYPSVTDFLLEHKGKMNFGGLVVTQFYSWFDDRNNRIAFDALKIIIPDILRDDEAKGKLYLEEHINYADRFKALWAHTLNEESYAYYLKYACDLSTSIVNDLDKLTPEWLLTQYREFMFKYKHRTVYSDELLIVTAHLIQSLYNSMPSYPVKDAMPMYNIALECFSN